jgi:hypothetical protein
VTVTTVKVISEGRLVLTARIKALLFGLLLVGVGLFILLTFGNVTSLQCQRLETSYVVCEKEVQLLGILSTSEETITGVEGAWVDEKYDNEDGHKYRVVLNTSRGDVPLTAYYLSGRGAKEDREDTAAQIKAYVRGEGEKTLEIHQSTLMGGVMGSFLLLVGLSRIFTGAVLGRTSGY